MKEILNKLIHHQTLSRAEAMQTLINLTNGAYNPAQIAAFLTIYMMRSITLHELEGFRDALLALCHAVDLSEYNPIDLCGTGGDGKDTFNISTLAAFVTAGSGVKVAKHGNYGVSSICGSSNVLEALGIRFSNEVQHLKKAIETAGICILHAPLFHPAMKQVAPIRKQLAIKTFFNMLGPLVNPAFPKNQLVGVFNLALARSYAYLYQNTNTQFTVLHALEGYDEIALTGNTKVITNHWEGIVQPSDFEVQKTTPAQITGGRTIAKAAKIFLQVLRGQGTEAQTNVVCANAGMAIATVQGITPKEGFHKAKAALLSGKALKALQTLQALSNSY